MKRALLTDVKALRLEEVNQPPCPRDGLVMKVRVCSVCATDVKIYNYGHQLLKLPRVLGHELAGEIAAVGEEWEGRYSVGQRVAVCAVINCGICEFCLRGVPSMCDELEAFGYHYDGGFQEYMVIPAKAIRCGGVNVLADSTPFEEAAVAELLACSLNGQSLSNFQMGETVLIIGSGPVGILHAQLALHRGASQVWMADIEPAKLDLARRICKGRLSGTLDNRDTPAFLREVREITGGRGFDQVMLSCGVAEVQRVSLECVAKLGCVNFFGGLPKGRSEVSLDTNLIHYKQCRVVGTHGSSVVENRMALRMIEEGAIDVKPLITDTVELENLEDVLDLGRPAPARLKAVVRF